MNTELIGEIYRSEGGLLSRPEDALRQVVEQYKQLLQKAGREIAQSWAISEETQAKLDEPLIPADVYRARHNEMVAGWRKRHLAPSSP
jgi:hypothetical protein